MPFQLHLHREEPAAAEQVAVSSAAESVTPVVNDAHDLAVDMVLRYAASKPRFRFDAISSLLTAFAVIPGCSMLWTLATVPDAAAGAMTDQSVYTSRPLLAWPIADYMLQHPVWAASSIMIVAVPLVMLATYNASQARRSEDECVSQADASWCGALIDALASRNARIRSAASRLLGRLLPLMTPAQAAALGADRWTALRCALRATSRSSEQFTAGVLITLSRFGGADVLKHVDRLARGEAGGWMPRHMRDLAHQTATHIRRRTCPVSSVDAAKGGAALTGRHAAPEGREAPAADPRLTVNQATEGEAARALDPAAATELKRLEVENAKHQPAMRMLFLATWWGLGMTGTAFEVYTNASQGLWPAAAAWSALLVAGSQLHRLTLTAKQKEAARRLASYDNVEGIPRLIDVLGWPDPALRSVAIVSLVRNLKQLRASDSRLLGRSHRAALNTFLDMREARKHREFLVAILKTLEQVGDDSSVPCVEKLAASRPRTASEIIVRQAAIDCLPFLQLRAQSNRESSVLLRASASAREDPASLVRPAAAATEDDARHYLRAPSGG